MVRIIKSFLLFAFSGKKVREMTTDDELLSKMKDYISRKLDQDSDPNAMKGIISEYMHMKGDDYR